MNYKRLWTAIIIGILLLLPSQYAKAEPIKLNMVFVPASEKGDDNDYVNSKLMANTGLVGGCSMALSFYDCHLMIWGRKMMDMCCASCSVKGKKIYIRGKSIIEKIMKQNFKISN